MVVGSGEPNAAPPGIRSGIHACALSRLLTLAFQAAFADPRRWISTGLTLAEGTGRNPAEPRMRHSLKPELPKPAFHFVIAAGWRRLRFSLGRLAGGSP